VSQYTKGEWEVQKMFPESYSYMIQDNSGKQICGIWLGNTASREIPKIEHKANAHLIAAAPNMYETGLQLLDVMCELCRRLNPQHRICQSCEEIEEYRKAFAKAEGKR